MSYSAEKGEIGMGFVSRKFVSSALIDMYCGAGIELRR